MDSVKIISGVLEGGNLLRRGPISIRGGAFLLEHTSFVEVLSTSIVGGIHFISRRGLLQLRERCI